MDEKAIATCQSLDPNLTFAERNSAPEFFKSKKTNETSRPICTVTHRLPSHWRGAHRAF